MGGACWCNNQATAADLNVTLDRPRRETTEPKESARSEVKYDEFLQKHLHIVVRLQAWARGNRARKQLAIMRSDNKNTWFAKYLKNGESDPAKLKWDDSEQSEEEDYSGCVEKPEVELEDGSKYTG